ncbi:MAG: hypothetical protein OXI91_05940 [Chloroflexota bacterium]|nr:hypothetical protein [Chloroflexota bacterium]
MSVPTYEPHPQELQALIAFYNATGGPNWKNNRNWLSDLPLHRWYGLRIFDGRVGQLRLPENELTGELPPDMGGLTNLVVLNLNGNRLNGEIPAELGSIKGLLELDLGGNELTGRIPGEIGNLTRLGKLNLAGNSLAGEFPPEMGMLSRLETLDLGGNELAGCIPRGLLEGEQIRVEGRGMVHSTEFHDGFDFGGLEPCADAIVATPVPTATPAPTPTAAVEPTRAPISTPVPAPDATQVAGGQPTPLYPSTPTAVPVSALSLSSLAWYRDGLTEREQHAVAGLETMERELPALYRTILGWDWVKDGVSENDEAWALASLQSYTAEDETLIRQLLSLPWYRNRGKYGGFASIDILRISWKEPSVAVHVASLPWIADGITHHERFTLSTIDDLTAIDPALTLRVLNMPRLSDAALPWQEKRIVSLTADLARKDVNLAHTFLDAPLFDLPLDGAGPREALNFEIVVRLPTLIERGLWDRITSQSWYRDGLTEEELILIGAAYELRDNRDAAIEIIDGVPTGRHIRVEEDYSLPLGGKVKLYAVSRDPQALNEVFELNRTAVVGIEDYIRVPYPNTYSGVFHEPTIGSNYRTLFVKVVNSGEYNTYHEVGHSYFRNGNMPKWLSEGAPEFLTSYLIEEGELDGQYRLLGCPQIGVNTVAESIAYREKLFNTGRGVTADADCAYTIGRKFLSVMYVELGPDVIATWLRELYLAGQNKIDPETSSDVRLTEAEIYQVLLSNTPATKREDFRSLYRELHGGPVP